MPDRLSIYGYFLKVIPIFLKKKKDSNLVLALILMNELTDQRSIFQSVFHVTVIP